MKASSWVLNAKKVSLGCELNFAGGTAELQASKTAIHVGGCDDDDVRAAPVFQMHDIAFDRAGIPRRKKPGPKIGYIASNA